MLRLPIKVRKRPARNIGDVTHNVQVIPHFYPLPRGCDEGVRDELIRAINGELRLGVIHPRTRNSIIDASDWALCNRSL